MAMLLELGVGVLVAFSTLSLLFGLVIIHSDLEGEPSWARKNNGWSNVRFINQHYASSSASKIRKKNDTIQVNRLNKKKKKRGRVKQRQISTPVTTRFFPTYGTDALFQQCNWTFDRSASINKNCTFLARPNPQTNEGISDWIPQIVSGHLMAQQKGCRLLFDYGDNVDISQVLTPFSAMNDRPNYRPINWTVPSGFDCPQNAHPRTCFQTTEDYRNGINFHNIVKELGDMALIPSYRFTYHRTEHFQLNSSNFVDLPKALPGFRIETGMACSLASLFHLSPRASQFVPNLFTSIIPTLHQDNAYVISLYIRTGQTDFRASMEKSGKEPPEEHIAKIEQKAERIIQCALRLEKGQVAMNKYQAVVWMVATDSPHLKQWIPQQYDTTNNGTDADSRSKQQPHYHRQVVTTSTRGVHTRAVRGPSTVDFAEALIDWYLIGESDVVVSDWNSPTFGGTASLRTARPYYKVPANGDPKLCSVAPIVHYG